VHNVLARGREVYPIDWESTAIGPGEVDLAAILEGWPRGIQQRIAEAYARARWDGTPPAGNSERLVAARLYWEFRWLGERPDWTLATKQAKRYPQLLQIAEEAGLL
jgi:thiamine kinase-like enzyme